MREPAARRVHSLVLDELAFKILKRIRKRAQHSEFRNLVVPMDDIIGWRAFATGKYEASTMDGIRSLFASGEIAARGVALDVGANIGLYSLFLASHFTQVVAFEISPNTHKVLVANIALSGRANVLAICSGASNRSGEADLHVSKVGMLGWSSLAEIPDSAVVTVRVDTLDSMLKQLGFATQHIGLIKIDVQLHEMEVLLGAERTLKRCAPTVLFEAEPGGPGRVCFEFLQSLGYCTFQRFRRRIDARSLFTGAPVVIEHFDPGSTEGELLVCASHPDGCSRG